MAYTNHGSKGTDSVQDADLLEMQLHYAKHLPWLTKLLEEVQFLRNERGTTQDGRITYLEGVLDELEVSYEDE